ncbi:MAG: hypothetical protein R3A50_01765 [Saprospiraceae bacterium]|nr:hypothetical protein [Saprospiraceae bacterium]
MPKRNTQLIRLIEVFSQTPFERPTRLYDKETSIASIMIFDGEEVDKALKGKTWQSMVEDPYATLGTFKNGLTFPRDFIVILSDKALLYYLPLFLSAIIINPAEADVLIDSLLSKFSSQSLFGQLSEAQQELYKDVMASFGD